MENKWIVKLERNDFFNRSHLLLIANGFVGVRASFGEIFSNAKSSVHVIGIYDQVGYNDPNKDPWHPEKDKWKEIIHQPNFMLSYLYLDGEKVELNDSNVEDFSVYLNMQTATITMEYTWKSSQGKKLKVKHERFCTYQNRNSVWSKINVSCADANADFILDAGIDGNVTDANGPHLENFEVGEMEGGYWLTTRTQQHKYEIGVSSKHKVSVASTSEIVKEEMGIRQKISVSLKKGKAVEIISQHAIYTSRDAYDAYAQAKEANFDYESEKKEHLAVLEKAWTLAEVEIDGDAKAQHYMLYNLYILLASIPKDYDYAGIPSRSLSAQTYKGAIFWEVDTYAFPFYAYLMPNYAKNFLLYRYKGMMYAIKKAKDLGFDGAYFAWESLDTGEEATKKLVWQDIHSGRMMRNYFGDRQYHIAGDVIFAAWQYFYVTGDWDFMLNYGAEMTLLTARFVSSLVYYKVTKDRYEILHTVCPDEYHEEVDNNAFTNRILKFTIEKSFELIELIKEKCPEKLDKVLGLYKITEDELDYWKDVAEKLYVIEPNDKFVIEQHDGYFGLEDISLPEFKSRIIRDEYLGHSIGPAMLTQIVKQADVIQLLVMFKNEYHPIVRKATFEYYDLRTEHGSGDSPNAYGIVSAQVGLREDAYRYFMKSAAIDLESTNPKQKANFFLGGVHIAPSGGTWQVVTFGFAGLEFDGEVVKFNPCLPKHWNRIKFNAVIKGQLLTVEINREEITVSSANGNTQELPIKVGDNAPVVVSPSGSITKSYRKSGKHALIY